MLTVKWDLSYTVTQDTHGWHLEHGLGFLTAWRSKEILTPYMAAHSSKPMCSCDKGKNCLGIHIMTLPLHCIAYDGV